jgi:hypothetical protein
VPLKQEGAKVAAAVLVGSRPSEPSSAGESSSARSSPRPTRSTVPLPSDALKEEAQLKNTAQTDEPAASAAVAIAPPLATAAAPAVESLLPSVAARSIAPRACHARSGACMEERPATHLLPPAGDARQLYNLSDPTAALRHNCEQLQLDMVEVPHIGKGLVARQSREAGELLGWMWGKLVSQDVFAGMRTAPHCDMTQQAGEEDYCAPIQQGILRAVATGGAGDVLLASGQCPMSLINHSDSGDPHPLNCSIDLTPTAYETAIQGLSEADHWTVFEVRATRRIEPGQQLRADYGWSMDDRELYAMPLKQRVTRSAAAAQCAPAADGAAAAGASAAPSEEAAGEDAVGLLQQWHSSTVALVSPCAPALWENIHKNQLRAADTAEMLLIAMGAVSEWAFYKGKVSHCSCACTRPTCTAR